jgi:ferredoxin
MQAGRAPKNKLRLHRDKQRGDNRTADDGAVDQIDGFRLLGKLPDARQERTVKDRSALVIDFAKTIVYYPWGKCKEEVMAVMAQNIVCYFSGTGNSLKVAKDLSRELGDCEIVSMTRPFAFTKHYDRIGFVFPTYFWGLPKKVIEFIKALRLDSNKNAYYYAIATYGGSAGNAVYQLYELLLAAHGVKLHYGQKLRMFSNYVVIYDMSENVDGIAKKSQEKLAPIIEAIKMKKHNHANKATKLFSFINKNFINKVSTMDRYFTVTDDCTGCGVCEKVCPANNIEIADHRPLYKHRCEQCVACIQFCPQRAINYKDATQHRRRYTNPEITYKELHEYNTR